MRYFTTDRIKSKGADFNIVVGERSNGKSTAVLLDIVEDWYVNRRAGGVIRQMELDIMGARGLAVFNYIVAGGHIARLTNDEWSGVKYVSRAWFLTKETVDGETITEKEPFAYAFALTQSSHHKSLSYPNIGTILFDEFIPETGTYIPDEVARFQSLLSTIVRGRGDVRIYLVANTVSWNSPYLRKYTRKGIQHMKPGDLEEYDFKKVTASGSEIVMKVAVEYCESTAKSGGKASDKYFIIDDERAKMIVDGQFAIPPYPKCPHAFSSRNVKFTAWITTDDGKLLRLRVIRVQRELFALVESVPADYLGYADERRDLFYSMEFTSRRNHFVSVLHPSALSTRTGIIAGLLVGARVFFSTIEAGEDFTYYANQAAQFGLPNL